MLRRNDTFSKFEEHYYITKFNAAMCAFNLFMHTKDQDDLNIALESYREYTAHCLNDTEFLRCINLHIPHQQIAPYSLSLRNIRLLEQYQELATEDAEYIEKEIKKRKLTNRRKKRRHKQSKRTKRTF